MSPMRSTRHSENFISFRSEMETKMNSESLKFSDLIDIEVRS